MKTGTPGFSGARLREAREARGLTASSLADLVGLSGAAISQFESDTTTPQSSVASRFSDVLRVPPEFFLRPAIGAEEDTIFYRSMVSTSKPARRRAGRRLNWLTEIVEYLNQYVNIPETKIPSPPRHGTWRDLSNEDVESAAEFVRSEWGLGYGPISNVVMLLENNGVIAARHEMGDQKLDALSTWHLADGLPYVILGTDKNVAVRSRFDIAHELGHLVLHRHVDRNNIANKSDFKLLETQAHRFAGAFLAPATTFLGDIVSPQLDSFLAVKPKWKISVATMIHRCSDLKIITEDQTRRLWINYSRRKWRGFEPMDERMIVEEPQLLRRAFELLVDQGIKSRAAIMSELPFIQEDVELIANLPIGYLDEESPYVWALNSFGKS